MDAREQEQWWYGKGMDDDHGQIHSSDVDFAEKYYNRHMNHIRQKSADLDV